MSEDNEKYEAEGITVEGCVIFGMSTIVAILVALVVGSIIGYLVSVEVKTSENDDYYSDYISKLEDENATLKKIHSSDKHDDELHDCWLCGSTAELNTFDFDKGVNWNAYVRCTNPKCQLGTNTYETVYEEDAAKSAKIAWNSKIDLRQGKGRL